MGIYNIIKLKNPEACFKCRNKISEFQTKEINLEGYPIMNVMMVIKLNDRMDGEMHTVCEKCGEFISFQIENGKVLKFQRSKD